MAQYTVQAPDGKEITLEGPAGLHKKMLLHKRKNYISLKLV